MQTNRILAAGIILTAVAGFASCFFFDGVDPPAAETTRMTVAMCWYAAVAGLAALTAVRIKGARMALFTLASLGLLPALFRLYGYWVSRRQPGVPEMIGYASSTLIFVLGALARPEQSAAAESDHRLRNSGVEFALWVAALGSALVLSLLLTPLATESRISHWIRHQAQVQSNDPRDLATIYVDVFADYQCPACRTLRDRYDPVVERLVAENPGRLEFRHFDFPLNKDCNPLVKQSVHPAACEEAVAVRVAAAHGRARLFADYFYSHQEGATAESVREYVAAQGLSEEFEHRYRSEVESIHVDIERAVARNVTGTPTYFVDGVRIVGWPVGLVEQAIRIRVTRLKK